ncbi:MAG: CapA family protein [Clostridium sp.]
MNKNTKILILVFLLSILLAVYTIPQEKTQAIKEDDKIVSNENQEKTKEKENQEQIKITLLGDLSFEKHKLENLNIKKLDKYFEHINKYTSSSQITSLNLQGSVIDNLDDLSKVSSHIITKSMIESLKAANIKYIQSANGINIKDSTSELFKMQENLSFNNIKYIGSKSSLDEEPYLIEEVNGKKIGLVNFTNLTMRDKFYYMDNVEISKQAISLMNTINYENLEEELKKVKDIIAEMKTKCDFIIFYMNFLDDNSTLTKDREKRIIEELNKSSVNIIVGLGKNKIKPIENIKNEFNNNETLVIYGLGNIKLSDNQCDIESSSIMVNITLDTKDKVIKVADVSYIPLYVYNYEETDGIKPRILPLNDIAIEQNNSSFKNNDFSKLEELKKAIIKIVENKENKIYIYKNKK